MIELSFTNVIIAVNVVLSLAAFNNKGMLSRFLMNPYQVVQRREYYRVLSHAFIHGDYIHLFFNMYVLFSFGNLIESIFTEKQFFMALFPDLEFWGASNGLLYYVMLYFGGILFSSLPSIKKHKDNPGYNSLGASGAVSAVVMAFILLLPTQNLQIMFIPIGIPAFILGGAYLAYEYYMSKRGQTGIAHDAHFFGAIYGMVLLIILRPSFTVYFFYQVGAFLGIA